MSDNDVFSSEEIAWPDVTFLQGYLIYSGLALSHQTRQSFIPL